MSNFRIRVEVPSVEIAFEVGSISEAAGILTDNETALANIAEMGANLANTYDGENGEETKPQETKQQETTKRRGRPPRVNTKDAPAPVPVPVPSVPSPTATPASAPVTPPVGDHGIPAELVRVKEAPVPPPVAPPSPPAPPASSGLADKIIENLKSRFAGAPDGGAALTAWLKSLGLTKADATIDEIYAVLRFQDQIRLESIAGALGVSA